MGDDDLGLGNLYGEDPELETPEEWFDLEENLAKECSNCKRFHPESP